MEVATPGSPASTPGGTGNEWKLEVLIGSQSISPNLRRRARCGERTAAHLNHGETAVLRQAIPKTRSPPVNAKSVKFTFEKHTWNQLYVPHPQTQYSHYPAADHSWQRRVCT